MSSTRGTNSETTHDHKVLPIPCAEEALNWCPIKKHKNPYHLLHVDNNIWPLTVLALEKNIHHATCRVTRITRCITDCIMFEHDSTSDPPIEFCYGNYTIWLHATDRSVNRESAVSCSLSERVLGYTEVQQTRRKTSIVARLGLRPAILSINTYKARKTTSTLLGPKIKQGHPGVKFIRGASVRSLNTWKSAFLACV